MISATRLKERIEKLSTISEAKEGYMGVTRRALTKEDREAQLLVKLWMEEAGMNVRLDSAGNLIGRKNGLNMNDKPIVIGSHIDSVENGGKYDGTIGVIGGIEVVQHITEEGIEITRPIEVIAFCEEEGSRFRSGGLFGSQAMVGKVSENDLSVQDSNGITRREALKQFGLDPNAVMTKSVIRTHDDMALYLEMHIEQGPMLENSGIPIGIVSHITGVIVVDVMIEGEANHAGTTPMSMRHDAFSGACELKLALEKITNEYGPPAVSNVGRVEIFPGGVNIIPGKVTMSLDIRDISKERREMILEKTKNVAMEISKNRGLSIQFIERLMVQEAICNDEILTIAKSEADNMNLNYLEMISGAGHDAQLIANICDIGMIFVRSQGGSHNPEEVASIDDITLGTNLLNRIVVHYAC